MTHIQRQKQTSSLHTPLYSWLLFCSIYKWVKVMNKWDSLLFPLNMMTGYISKPWSVIDFTHVISWLHTINLLRGGDAFKCSKQTTNNCVHPKLTCVWRPWHLFSLPRCKRGITYRSFECVLVSWIILQFMPSEVVLELPCRKNTLL